MDLISRQEAREQGLTRYLTGLACKRGHISERLVSTGNCCACNTKHGQQAEVKERKAATTAAWHAANKERRSATNAAHYRANKERKAATNAAWQAANKKQTAATAAAYAKENPAVRAAINAQRRAAKLQRTPKWADRAAIKQIYDDCAFLSRVMGEPFHVDHIFPLQADWVCGFHTEANLQILTRTENSSKGNRYVPSLIPCD